MTELSPMLTAPQVCDRIGVTTMTLHRWLRDPEVGFPKPIQIKRFRFWPEPEIAEWLEGKRMQ